MNETTDDASLPDEGVVYEFARQMAVSLASVVDWIVEVITDFSSEFNRFIYLVVRGLEKERRREMYLRRCERARQRNRRIRRGGRK